MTLLQPPAPKPYILFYVIGIIIFPLCLVLLDRRIGHARLKMGINASVLVYFRPTGLCVRVTLCPLEFEYACQYIVTIFASELIEDM